MTAVQFDLTIPSGLVPSIDSVQKTSRETDHILQATSLGSNIYRFILYSPTSTVLKDTIGDIMKLPIYASGSSGSYSVQLQNVSISDTSGHNISTSQQNGTMKIINIGLPLLSQSFVNFGNVRKDDSLTQRITFYNQNLTNIFLKPISFSLSQGFNLVQTGDSSVLQQGDSASFGIKFKPASFGTFTDTATVVSDGGTVKIAVIGTSPIPTLTNLKTSIAYGNVAKNTTKTDTVKVVNSSINTLIVDSIYTKTSAFTVSKSNGTAGSDTLKVIVSFTPTTIASYADTVYLHNNSATALVKVPLSGISPKPIILCNPRIIAFDDVGIYDSSKTILKIANSSISILIIDSIYTHSAAFTASSSFCQATNKDTAMITIFFKPVKFGSFIDTLCLRNNSDTALFKIPLSGNTPNSSISITPSSIVFGTAKKDSTKQLLFTITNPSISVLQIDSFWTHMLARGQVRIGDSTKVTIRFTPDSSRSYVDTMFIANNSPVSPFKVPLSGNGTLTGVKNNQSGIPTVFSLSQNYPNPFNPSTTIQYGLPARSIVRIVIYNILGQAVKELINSEQQAGYQSIVWNAKVASGMYFYRIVATSLDNTNKRFIETKKMLFLK